MSYALATSQVICGQLPFPSGLVIWLSWSGLLVLAIVSVLLQIGSTWFATSSLNGVCTLTIAPS